MAFFLYASFPNSRIKPRPSTQQANTYQVTLADSASPLTLVAPPNANRTYIILKNLSTEVPVLYCYATVTVTNPSLVATNGVPNQLLLFGSQLYQKQDPGVTTNWVAVNVTTVGESIDQLQSASLDQINDGIYMAYDATLTPANPVLVGIDEGRG